MSNYPFYVVCTTWRLPEISQELSRHMQPEDQRGPMRMVYRGNEPTDETYVVVDKVVYDRMVESGWGNEFVDEDEEELAELYIHPLVLEESDFPDFSNNEKLVIHIPLSREWSVNEVKKILKDKLTELQPFHIVPASGWSIEVPTRNDGNNCGMATIKFPKMCDSEQVALTKRMINDTAWEFKDGGDAYISARWHRGGNKDRRSRRGDRRGAGRSTSGPQRTSSTPVSRAPLKPAQPGAWGSVPKSIKEAPTKDDFPALPTRPVMEVSGTTVAAPPSTSQATVAAPPQNHLMTPASLSTQMPAQVLVAYSGQAAPGFSPQAAPQPVHQPTHYAPPPHVQYPHPTHYAPQVQYVPPPPTHYTPPVVPQASGPTVHYQQIPGGVLKITLEQLLLGDS